MKEGFLVACHHCYASQWKGMIELLFEVQWLIDRLSISKMITNHLAAVKLVWETNEKNMQIFLVCSLHFPLAKNVNLANGCLFISGESTINRINRVQFMQYNKGDICAYVWHRFLHLNTPAVVAAASQSHGPSSLCPLPTRRCNSLHQLLQLQLQPGVLPQRLLQWQLPVIVPAPRLLAQRWPRAPCRSRWPEPSGHCQKRPLLHCHQMRHHK